ncbi:MAG: SCP2 sterol-binding domain-containing protein [Anaerolineales bacterium]|jgi:putative sterol carrier protein
MADEITIEELMNRMPKAFLPDKAGDVEAVIQYHLTGEEAGDWVVKIGDGKCEVEKGTTDNATMTLKADSQDYKDIILGKLDPMTAFMQQKVKLTGNLNMALGLTKYFKMG